MSEIYDEASYVKYAEKIIFDLQRTFRLKPGLEIVPVIEMSAMLEELCFHQALLDNAPVPSGDCLWLKKDCINQYQHRCEKMLRNLDAKERNWKKILEENEKNAKIVLSAIMRDDDAGRRKDDAFRSKPAKQPVVRVQQADRLKNLTNIGSKSTKGGNKKGAIGKRKTGSTSTPKPAALLNSSVNWADLHVLAPSDTLGLSMDDDFNLEMFDDEASHSIPLSNAEAWQAPLSNQDTSSQSSGISGGNSGNVWQSAIAEKESSVSREKELKLRRESQQDVLRKARDEGLQNAAAKREEGENAARNAMEREKKEKALAQLLKDEARERERNARENIEMTMDLDNDRGLLDE